MYSQPNLMSTAADSKHEQKKLLGNSFDENEKIFNVGRMYSTKQSLSVDNMAKETKKEGIWQTLGQSITRSASTKLSESFTRNTSSLIKNWTNMNSPLSVTVVSPDLVKSLHSGDKTTSGVGYYASKMLKKDSTHSSSDEILASVLYPNEIVSDSVVKKSNSDSSDIDKRWREYKNLFVDCDEMLQGKDLTSDKKIVDSVNKTDSKDEMKLDTPVDTSIVHQTLDRSANFGNIVDGDDDDPVMLEIPTCCTETQKHEEPQEQKYTLSQDKQMQQQRYKQSETSQQKQTAISTIMSNACKKIVNGVENLLKYRSSSPESMTEPSSALFTKRACSSKPRKKMNNIMVSRGRGRGKPQLRNSGVSQTRHRKERSRYDQSAEIKSDIDSWEELEYCNSTEDEERYDDVDECDFAKPFEPFTLAEVKPKKSSQKQQQRKKGNKAAPAKEWEEVNYTESSDESEDDSVVYFDYSDRSRKSSECSIDSEISFRSESDSKECDDTSDYDSEDEEEGDEQKNTGEDAEENAEQKVKEVVEGESDDDDFITFCSEEDRPTRKVHFNLIPKVHLLLHWKFAHHAARLGPWEQMARDNVRFQDRIKCVGMVLEPVLSGKHRQRIFKDRFENE